MPSRVHFAFASTAIAFGHIFDSPLVPCAVAQPLPPDGDSDLPKVIISFYWISVCSSVYYFISVPRSCLHFAIMI